MRIQPVLLMGICLSFAGALPALAERGTNQDSGQQRGGAPPITRGTPPATPIPRGTMQQDRVRDVDQLRDADQARDQDQDQDQDQDRDLDQDQDQDQDRDRDRDRDQDRDQIYGYQLMTQDERDTYRNTLRSLNTEQERETFRLQHHAEMQKRAEQRGVTLPAMPARQGMGPGGMGMGPGPGMQATGDGEPIYGYQLMTPEERNSYRDTLRSLNTEQEREAFRLQHHAEMQKRAEQLGVTLPAP